MEFHKNLPKFLPNEKQKYEDELISQNEYDNIDKEIMEKVLTNKSSKNFVEEEDDNELFSEGFNHEGEKLYLPMSFDLILDLFIIKGKERSAYNVIKTSMNSIDKHLS